MSDSFFQKKRKRPSDSGGSAKAGPSRPRMREKSGAGSSGGGSGGGKSKRGGRPAAALDDEDLGSGTAELGDGDDGDSDDGGIEGMDLAHRYDEDVLSSDEDKAETPAEARVRLARMYLDSLKDEDVDPEDADAAEIDRQNISSRLQADAATHSSHVHTFVADRLRRPSTTSTEHILACRGHHRMPLTSVVVSADRASFWTAAKDGKIIRWRLYDGKMLEVISKARRTCQTHANGAEPAPARRGKHSGVRRSSSSGAARRRARAHAATKATHNDDRKANGSTSTAGRNGDSGDVPSLQYVALGDNEGHRDEVWALAVSSDGRHLVSGGKDRRICVWAIGNPAISFISNGKTDKHDAEAAGTSFVRALGGHKDSITALRFRQGSHDLFTASADRTLKLFDVSQLSYVETFFGHQEEVAGMDVLRGEVVVTAGSRDRTLRWWKVRDESQLVFRGGAKSKVRDVLEGGDIALDEDGVDHPIRENGPTQNYVEGSIDAVAMVDEHSFLSGGDSGTISLWSLAKKKPIFTVPVAHGCDEVDNGEHKIRTPRWITSLTCLPYGDVFASGSWDGTIRLWKLEKGLRSFTPLLDVPAPGFVTSMELVLPSRTALRRLGREAVQPTAWRRRGGLRGGAKRVFSEDDSVSGDSDEEDGNGEDGESGERSDEGITTTQQANGHTTGVTTQQQLILVAAIGQEPTRGRWRRLKEARNGALVVPLSLQ